MQLNKCIFEIMPIFEMEIDISRKLSTAHISKLKPFSVLFSIEIVVSFKKSKQIGQETARALLLRVF